MMRPPAPLPLALGAVLALVCASSAPAQNWSAGIKGGIGKGSFTGQQEFAWETGALSAVGFINRRITPRLSVQAEVFETQKLGTSMASGSPLTFNAHYTDLPVLLRYRLPGFGPVHPFVTGGPSLSLELSCNQRFVTGSLVSNITCGSASNRTDYGVAAGGGFDWTVGIATLTIEARESMNFRSVVLSSKNSHGVGMAVLAGVSVPLARLRRSRPGTGQLPTPLAPIRTDAFVPGPSAASIATPQGAEAASAKRITLNAVGADARALLVAIAKEAGISLVVSDDVRRRISLSLNNASAEEALRAIIAEAGLTVVEPRSSGLPPVVYYQLPVNMNQASADALAARFGVSAELARWIVESRGTRPERP